MTGYEKDSTSTCIDINECAANDACPANQKCKNIDGSFTCSCEDGYAVGATVKDACEDINECAATEACPANQECKNADGSFTCSCLVGLWSFYWPFLLWLVIGQELCQLFVRLQCLCFPKWNYHIFYAVLPFIHTVCFCHFYIWMFQWFCYT